MKMAKITRFEDLDCWRASRELAKAAFEISDSGKLKSDWDAKSQVRRAAISVMNNIAEGFSRYRKGEFIRFLDIAQSSAAEVKSMLYLFEDVAYLKNEDLKMLHQKVDKARNLTLGLIAYVEKQQHLSKT
jgi:four helix bundle protein